VVSDSLISSSYRIVLWTFEPSPMRPSPMRPSPSEYRDHVRPHLGRPRDGLAILVLTLSRSLGHASLFSDVEALSIIVVTASWEGAIQNEKKKKSKWNPYVSNAEPSEPTNMGSPASVSLKVPSPSLQLLPSTTILNGYQRSKRAKQFSTSFGTYEKPGFPCVSSIVRSPSGLAT